MRCTRSIVSLATLLVVALGAGSGLTAPARNIGDLRLLVETADAALTDQQLAELNTQLVQARAATAEAKARLDRITELLNSAGLDSDSWIASIASVASLLNDAELTKLCRQYQEYADRAAEWSRRYGADHLAVVNLRAQMHEISKAINDALERIAEVYRSDYDIAKTREEAVEKTLTEAIRRLQNGR